MVSIRESGPFLLHAPLDVDAKTAVVGFGAWQTGRLRGFPYVTTESISRFAPEAIAAPLQTLLELSKDIEPLRRILVYPMIVFSWADGNLITNQERDILWNLFGLPVFEQLRTRHGTLLACECEAHDGLHWVADERPHHFSMEKNPWRGGHWIASPCACGADTQRIRRVWSEPLLRSSSASSSAAD